MVNPALGCYGVYKKNIKSSQHACTVSPTCKTIPDQQQRVQSSQFNSPQKKTHTILLAPLSTKKRTNIALSFAVHFF